MKAPARHKLHTQEGKNRYKTVLPPYLIDLDKDEKRRVELYRKLQYFPTPPWATRALIAMLEKHHPTFAQDFYCSYVLEPCAGRGHIVETLRELNFTVRPYDIHDYGKGYFIANFLTVELKDQFDAVFMNPPFSDNNAPGEPTIADLFIQKALTLSEHVFVFGRLGFLTPAVRYQLMRDHLEQMFVFVERVPIALGRIAKKGGATDYGWYHFRAHKTTPAGQTRTILIPPGMRDTYTRRGDDRR